MLDVLAAVLSHGDSTSAIGERGGETRVSQVFIAIDVVALSRAGVNHDLQLEIIFIMQIGIDSVAFCRKYGLQSSAMPLKSLSCQFSA